MDTRRLLRTISASAFVVLLGFAPGGTRADDLFPTPEILNDNVAFWKKIYTEVSVNEGLLHDRDHPLVIFAKVPVGENSGREKQRVIKEERERFATSLAGMAEKPPSLWTDEQRQLASMYKERGVTEGFDDAVERIRYQQGQKERYLQGLRRSGAYIDSIRAILAQYRVPERLIYLPHVESSFNPHAYSKVGAAGLWQFMRSTAKLYLEVGYLIDERRDPILSTHAAAKLLTHNFSVLQSWPLAITAYNHGLNGMKRAVEATGSRDIAVIIEKHQSASFKFASKNFYSCFLAASEIAMEPTGYFGKVSYAPPVRYNTITLDHFIAPSSLAEYLHVPAGELSAMNLAIRPVAFEHDKPLPKGTRLHVPVTLTLVGADSALAAIPDSLKAATPPRPNYYRVERGDNLYGIARRLGVTVEALAQENGLTRVNRIYAGQVLQVPGARGEPAAVEVASVNPEAEPTPRRPKPPAPAEPDTATPTPVEPTPLLTLPDTLQAIAMVAAEVIPESVTGSAGREYARFDVDVYDLEVTVSPRANSASFHVSVDETIGHYADWLATPSWKFRQMNQMGNRTGIRLGQRLSIPVEPDVIERFRQRRLEYHMGLEEDFYSQYLVSELRSHRVQRGETLWEICAREGGIPLWLLNKHNRHADLSSLKPGDSLWVPVIAERTAEALADNGTSGEHHREGIYPYYREPAVAPNRPILRTP